MKLSKDRGIDLYWFSGTGNSLFIAKRLAEYLTEKGFEVFLKPLESSSPDHVDLTKILGFVIPVAEQGTYPFIWDFIGNIPSPAEKGISDAAAFLVDTMMVYSGGIKGPVKKILKRKGFLPLGAIEIVMPNNLMKLKHQPEKDKLKTKKGAEQVCKFADALIAGNAVWRDIPVYSDLMSLFSKSDSTWNLFRNKFPLKVDNSVCTRCRLCERNCPTDSWKYDKEDQKMIWIKDECIFCLRCFSYCPVEAIGYGKKNYLKNKPLTAGAFSVAGYKQHKQS